jgi:hypothetical protein
VHSGCPPISIGASQKRVKAIAVKLGAGISDRRLPRPISHADEGDFAGKRDLSRV